MSFLGKLFNSIEQLQKNKQSENKLPTTVKMIVLGQEANTFKTKFVKPGQFLIEIDSIDKADELKQHLSDAGLVLICPNNLDELKVILANLKTLLDEHPNIVCRIVTNNPEIINAIQNKSCLLYPPTEESSQTFYIKLKDTYLSQKWNESSDKKILQYSLLSPLPSSLFNMPRHQSENDYPTLKENMTPTKINKPVSS
ncbi:MAG: hypothetical protein P4M14_03945 [Gammaproteobacteria bacterium]|nr:hypothetical protein [Gammaproteobacteria bacterium]